jgi:PAP2 superfamily
MPRALAPIVAAIAAFASCAPLNAENTVLVWNQEAINATRLSRNPPPMASLLYATYHLAIFDTVNSFDRHYHGWLVDDAAPAGADEDAAIAAAAFTVLDALWSPTSNPENIRDFYASQLALIADGPAKDAGVAWGAKVAKAILAKRADCGFDKPIPGTYTGQEVGVWRETPSSFRPALLPYWGHVKPFSMTSAEQFRCPPPLDVHSKQYADEIAYVDRVGRRDGAERTDYETECTPFWSDDLGTSTPPGHWNMIAQDLARRNKLGVAETARLFALLNMAEADSAIQCWETKFYYRVWRPETALRELDTTVNPYVHPDPGFIPNMASPPFPSYSSGHSTFSGAGARTMARFFGTDEIAFSVTSDGLPGVIHSFKRLSDAQKEAGMSRVWGGIHTMSDNLSAQEAGMKIADWVLDHELLPRKG